MNRIRYQKTPLLWRLDDLVALREENPRRSGRGRQFVATVRWEDALDEIRETIRDHSSPEPFTACWLWEGAFHGKHASIRGIRHHRCAHVVSFLVFNGEIPFGQVVRHRCDCHICVNPAHLELGTVAQNLADFHNRGKFQPEYLNRFGFGMNGAQ